MRGCIILHLAWLAAATWTQHGDGVATEFDDTTGILTFQHTNGTTSSVDFGVPPGRRDTPLVPCSLSIEYGSELLAMMATHERVAQHVVSVVTVAADVLRTYGLVNLAIARILPSDMGMLATADDSLAWIQTRWAPVTDVCAHYFVGQRIFETGTIGIAFVGGGCWPAAAFGAVFNFGDTVAAVVTLLHELGHTFGAEHSATGIMHATFIQTYTYAARSLNEMHVWTAAALAQCPALIDNYGAFVLHEPSVVTTTATAVGTVVSTFFVILLL